MLFRKASALVATALVGSFAFSDASTAGQVKMEAELGQTVIASGGTERIYLRINLEGIAEPSEGRRTPVNVALVIDRSGSMKGEKIRQARKAAIMALNRLGRDDIASVVVYNHSVDVLVPATRVGGHDEMADEIRDIRATGRTALYAGTTEGIDQVRNFLSDNMVNRVILLSDGLANVGPSSPDALARLGREAVDRGISITTIGLGLGYNEDLMAKLAYNSDGNHAFVEHPDQLVGIFNDEFGDVLSVVAQDIIINIEIHNGFRPRRVLGRQAKISGNKVSLRLNQVYGAQKKYVVLELDAPKGAKIGSAEVADVRIDYKSMATRTRINISQQVNTRFTKSVKEARASINKTVMTDVTSQIANETNERAVKLRDSGKVKAAKKLLQDNAAYLSGRAEQYGSIALQELGEKNAADAATVDADGSWGKTRKAMRARQHKLKSQQSY